MNSIELHLQELGFFPVKTMAVLEDLNEIDNRTFNPTRELGYYRDPRDENGEVPF